MAELILRAPNKSALLRLCMAELEAAGHVVDSLLRRETPGEFCARVGVSKRTLRRRLASPFAPKIRVWRGQRMRITALESTPRFDRFAREGRTCGQNTHCLDCEAARFVNSAR
jgi:hypothetical protein